MIRAKKEKTVELYSQRGAAIKIRILLRANYRKWITRLNNVRNSLSLHMEHRRDDFNYRDIGIIK